MPKVYIEDLVARLAGREEGELPVKTAIRFETDTDHYTIQFEKDNSCLSIYKITKGINNDTIIIVPYSTNKIFIQ